MTKGLVTIITVKHLPPCKTDQECLKNLDKYSYIGFGLYLDNKIIKLDALQKLINKGVTVSINQGDGKFTNKIIYCSLKQNDPWDGTIPQVTKSKHPRFVKGTRFDYGFMSVSIRDGYNIIYNHE